MGLLYYDLTLNTRPWRRSHNHSQILSLYTVLASRRLTNVACGFVLKAACLDVNRVGGIFTARWTVYCWYWKQLATVASSQQQGRNALRRSRTIDVDATISPPIYQFLP